MSRDYADLIRDRAAVLLSIEGSTAAIDRPQLVDELGAALDALAASRGALYKSNVEKSAAIRSGIQRAADDYLTESVRRIRSSCAWAGGLQEFLERRHFTYDLEQQPGIRTIRKALINWVPPISGSVEKD